MHRLAILFLFLVTSGSALAQSLDCVAFTQNVIETTREACSTLEQNQACYGNAIVEVQPRPNVRLDFSESGDIVSLAAFESISTAAFDADDETWGMSLMNIRSDIAEGHLTALAFGQTTVQNNSEASADFVAVEITVTEPTGANLRAEPKADAAIVRGVYSGDRLQAIGRLEDTSWVRIADGWLSIDVIRNAPELSQLQVLEPDSQIADVFAPLQSIGLRTGLDDAPCAAAPESGLLLQTPVGVSTNLEVNSAGLTLSGTLLLQTTADGKTILSLLEGELLYNNGYRLKPAESIEYGFQGSTILYTPPVEYDYANARYLPLVLLPREFELPFSLGGVIFPFTPGTGFLQTFTADSPCVAAWTVDVNLRSGPGTNYPIRRGVTGGYYGNPDARAIGSDGAVWWRLGEGVWIAADNTAAAGACGNLPLVSPPPLPAG
ncbi:MAG: SH3 domain-containing protein [Chloroflexi bacterium]|nr:SH3 domain-containing protein [Chloroflexota bacterium]